MFQAGRVVVVRRAAGKARTTPDLGRRVVERVLFGPALSAVRGRIGHMNLPVPLPPEPHRSEAYADWARAHDPGAEAAAVDLLADVRDRISRAYPKAGRALDGMEFLARALPPSHLPWYWDTMAHRLISWDLRAAGRAYTLARTAEREHALPVDPAWRRANVLLLAGAGALPVKELSGHQGWLAGCTGPGRRAHGVHTGPHHLGGLAR